MKDANQRRNDFIAAMQGESQDDILDALHAIADNAGYGIEHPSRGSFCLGYITSYVAGENRYNNTFKRDLTSENISLLQRQAD